MEEKEIKELIDARIAEIFDVPFATTPEEAKDTLNEIIHRATGRLIGADPI